MNDSVRTLLGFDYGERRIGVAVGQSLTGTATALTTIDVRDDGPDWDAIGGLLRTWHPHALIVGLPVNMDGTEQTMTDRARRFGRQLHGRFGLVVHWADERLSTREASDRLRVAGRSPQPTLRPGTRARRGRTRHATGLGSRDAVAAQVILEGWLSERCAGTNHAPAGTSLGVSQACTDARSKRPKEGDEHGS